MRHLADCGVECGTNAAAWHLICDRWCSEHSHDAGSQRLVACALYLKLGQSLQSAPNPSGSAATVLQRCRRAIHGWARSTALSSTACHYSCDKAHDGDGS